MDFLRSDSTKPSWPLAFVFRAVEEAGAALNCALVVMGDRLGYYRCLAEHGASTAAELAQRTGFSTLLCTPSSLAQPVGLALGTQAGPARIEDVVTQAGFTRFRLAANTPFNNVFEVRP